MAGPLIDEIWQSGPDWPGEVRVLPDGGLDLIWAGDALVVAGPDRTGRVVQLQPGGPAFCGVRFKPGAARAVFGAAAESLVDGVVPAQEVLDGDAASVLSDRLAAVPPSQHPRILASWATSGARVVDGRDPVVARTAEVLSSDPTRSVASLAAEVGFSERQLRRRVVAEVGYSPKRLARILRLRRVIGLAGDDAAMSLADAAFVGGYADQAHLAHECTAIGGATAAVLLGR